VVVEEGKDVGWKTGCGRVGWPAQCHGSLVRRLSLDAGSSKPLLAIIPQSTPLPQLASLEEYPEAEVREICEHAEPFFADVFRFPALTGLRQAELTWLTREDPDAEHRLVRIRAKVFPEEGLRWDPKGDDRVVPLSAPALAIAKEMLARSGGCWLFAAPAGPGVVDDRLRASRLWAQREKAKKAAAGWCLTCFVTRSCKSAI
jgi:integrase